MELTYGDYLEHYGIKGMKWGVRKSEKSSPSGKLKNYKSKVKDRYNRDQTRELRSVEVTSKKGEKVVATEDRSYKLASFLSSLKETSYQDSLDNPSFSITVNGEKVGESSFSKKKNGEINLVWLGVNPEYRGRGYASSVFDAAVEYGRSEGAKKLTLEVPGNAPDARHIYEKRGFKVTKEPTEKEKKTDIVWGGLTHMALDLEDSSLKHIDQDDLELEKAFEKTFAKLPKDVEEEVFNNMPEAQHNNLTYDNYLEHYGVKGMKWGVRKSDKSSDVSGNTVRSSKRGKIKGVELSEDNKQKASRPSDDKTEASILEQRIKKGSTDSLSNKELELVVNRKNLEKRYAEVTSKEKERGMVGFGRSVVKDLAKDYAKNAMRNTISEATTFGQSTLNSYAEKVKQKRS